MADGKPAYTKKWCTCSWLNCNSYQQKYPVGDVRKGFVCLKVSREHLSDNSNASINIRRFLIRLQTYIGFSPKGYPAVKESGVTPQEASFPGSPADKKEFHLAKHRKS
jgi:hypothetical protein